MGIINVHSPSHETAYSLIATTKPPVSGIILSDTTLFGGISVSNGTEANARSKIDLQLRQVGWEPSDVVQVRQEYTLDDGTRADYVLRDRLGRPLAVIEAKRTSVDPVEGERQALHYAEKLGVKLIFLANGTDIWFWPRDLQAHPHKVRTFYSQSDLERISATFSVIRRLNTVPIDTKIAGGEGRRYQIDCINTVSDALLAGRRKILIEMATGTGKTRTAAALIKRLFDAGYITRVLFLVDREALADQTEKALTKVLPEHPCYVLRRGRFRDEKQITITTLQSMINVYKEYSAGYFDLVITDECHRSIYGKWKSVLSYYDGIQIGLTATPCVAKRTRNPDDDDEDDKLVRDTLKFFECDKPTFSYGIREAIRDGHLVRYYIYKAKTNLMLREGGIEVKKSDLDHEDNDPALVAELFRDKDTIIVDPQDLERKFTIPARNRAIVREFRQVLECGFQDAKGKHQPVDGKTIVFAVTKKHAQTLAQMFDEEFADRKIDNCGQVDPTIRYVDYVVSGEEDRPGRSPKSIIEEFMKEPYPKILVSVGMLDTGFDCPEVVNLVMARFIRSSVLYQQMRGRGLRKADHIGKKFCTIFDFAGVTDYFHDEADYPEGGPVIIHDGPKTKYHSKRRGVLTIDLYDEIAEESREWIEVNEEGERVDVRTYVNECEAAIRALQLTPEVQKVLQKGDFETHEDQARFEERLHQSNKRVTLEDLRTAMGKPFMKWKHFIRHVILGEELNTDYEELTEIFDAWMAAQSEPFTEPQVQILTMMKNQFARNRKLVQEFDMTRFNRPPFLQLGGLTRIKQLFGDSMEQLIQELNELFKGDDSGNGVAS